MLCGGGLDTKVQAGLLATLQGWAKSLRGSVEIGAEAGKKRLGALFADIPSGQQIDPTLYKAFLDCALRATGKILDEGDLSSLKKLHVYAEVFDSRGPRENSGPVYHAFSKTYARGDEIAVGNEIAEEMMRHLGRLTQSTALKVTILNNNGRLQLQDGVPGGFASLHVSRFIHVHKLADFVKQPPFDIEYHANNPSTAMLLAPLRPPSIDRSRSDIDRSRSDIDRSSSDIDPRNLDWASRAGLYRIAVTAPFYNEEVIYAELSPAGDLFVPEGAWRPSEPKLERLSLPLSLSLRRSGDALKVALAEVDITAPNFANLRFTSETRNLTQGFAEAIGKTRNYEYVAGGSAVYDPRPRKGLPSDRELADVEVRVHATVTAE
jgi:hypothetical protein